MTMDEFKATLFSQAESRMKVCGGGSSVESWENALNNVLGEKYPHFTHFFPITGEDHSIRACLVEPHPEAADFNKPLTARELAEGLEKLGSQSARYSEKSHRPGSVKGWMIYQASFNDKPIAVAHATWI